MQYIKDRTENLDDYFQCRKKKCKLKHVKKWFNLFIDQYNKEIISKVKSADFLNQMLELS
jgi:hypothetical protein